MCVKVSVMFIKRNYIVFALNVRASFYPQNDKFENAATLYGKVPVYQGAGEGIYCGRVWGSVCGWVRTPLFFCGTPSRSGYRRVVECVHNATKWIMYRSGGMVPRGKASQVASGRGGNWAAREEKGGVSFGKASRGA